MSQAFFSIIIPVFNREREVARAVKSALIQNYPDFEIIVVDDGSFDTTPQVVTAFNDPRICLVQHHANRGVCPARNTGIVASKGTWIVFLDSDDELVPGALGQLAERIKQATPDVARIAGMYKWDDGILSPDPAPKGQILDYENYIRWTTTIRRSDFHNCIRRTTFEQVRLPDNRAYETLYHLDFARLFSTWLVPDLIALEHQDAANHARNLKTKTKVQKLLRDAPDGLWASEMILANHGNTLYRLAPDKWRLYLRIRILQSFLAKKRHLGTRYVIQYLQQCGYDSRVVFALGLGLLGARPLAWAQAMR